MTRENNDQDQPEDRTAPELRQDAQVSGGTNIQAGRDVHFHAATAAATVVRTLPRDLTTFTGREDQVRELLEAAGRHDVVAIHAVEGMPGVGKTALVTHVAHQLSDRYPDGQLFVDLQAHAPGLASADPGDVLYGLLGCTGMQADQIPPGLNARVQRWRGRLVGKRVLLVLDDADDRKQVEPLLPGEPGCLVLITSRRPIDLDDADSLPLKILPPEEAIRLFTRLTRRTFTGGQADQVAELVGLAAGLPLAVALMAAKARRHLQDQPGGRLEEILARFTEADRLAQLTAGGRPGDRAVAVAFEMSYRHLRPDEQRLFRLLGLCPGPDIDAYATAALAGTPLAQTHDELDTLRDEYLLQALGAGRYRLHDLLRAYARILASRDPATDRDAALDRLLDYYERTANTANRHLSRVPRPADTATVSPAAGPDLPDRAAALTWMRTEQANLLACIDHTNARHLHDRTIALTAAIAPLLRLDGPWLLAITLHQQAAAAARHTQNHHARAGALLELARVSSVTGDFALVTELQEQARALYRALGNRFGEANALFELGCGRAATGDYAQAIDLQKQARARYRALGNRFGEANTLLDQSRAHSATADYAQASDLLKQARALYRDLGDWLGEANTFVELGRGYYLIADYAQASDLLEQARALYRDLGNRFGEASTLLELGRVRFATGDYAQATDLQEQARALYRDLGIRYGEASTLNELGRLHALTGNYVLATDLIEQTGALYRELGNRIGEANTLNDLGRVHYLTGDYALATDLQAQSRALFSELGNRHGEANTLNELGRVRAATGDYAQATDLFAQALALYREVGDRQGETEVLCGMAGVLKESAGPARALRTYEQALGLARQVGGLLDEAHALEGIARCNALVGDPATATGPLREAVGIYQRLGVPEAVPAAAYLAELESGA